ncbi:MAG: hypothetical protein R3C97_00945 [Geminicoccaceae bacterium]
MTERSWNTRERVPLDWAGVQNNRGNVLQALGGRESGTKRLEMAVEAYDMALLERTRERVPLEWAMTQNNLGLVLLVLGERTSQLELLERAREAVASAREVVVEEAGMVHRDSEFRKRLAEIDAAIVKLGKK